MIEDRSEGEVLEIGRSGSPGINHCWSYSAIGYLSDGDDGLKRHRIACESRLVDDYHLLVFTGSNTSLPQYENVFGIEKPEDFKKADSRMRESIEEVARRFFLKHGRKEHSGIRFREPPQN